MKSKLILFISFLGIWSVRPGSVNSIGVDAAIGRLFLQGISTRRLRSIARELFGQEVSATTVSRTAGYLDEEFKCYQTRPLSDDFPLNCRAELVIPNYFFQLVQDGRVFV